MDSTHGATVVVAAVNTSKGRRDDEEVLEYEAFIPGTAADPPSAYVKPKKKEIKHKDENLKIPCGMCHVYTLNHTYIHRYTDR